VLSSEYLDGLPRLTMPELRDRRNDCQDVGTRLSYFRRLVQGRLDIIHAELTRREGGGEAPPGLQQLIEQLPTILAEHTAGPARGQLPEVVAPPDVEELSAQLDAIVDADKLASLPTLADDAIRNVAEKLTELERTVSAQRRSVHERIDALQEEIVKRYRTGEATVDALLS
jgi:hypothetical protein